MAWLVGGDVGFQEGGKRWGMGVGVWTILHSLAKNQIFLALVRTRHAFHSFSHALAVHLLTIDPPPHRAQAPARHARGDECFVSSLSSCLHRCATAQARCRAAACPRLRRPFSRPQEASHTHACKAPCGPHPPPPPNKPAPGLIQRPRPRPTHRTPWEGAQRRALAVPAPPSLFSS